MAVSSSRGRRPTRFDQVTSDQEKTFRGGTAKLLLSGRLRSWKGKKSLRKYFEKALKGFEADVSEFKAAAPLTDAFVLMCNRGPSNPSPRSFENLRSQLNRGVLAFARSKGFDAQPLSAWPRDLGEQLVRWLRQDTSSRSGERISGNTARKRYGDFCGLFAELAEHEKLAKLLPQLEPFPTNPFSGAHANRVKTKSLGQPTLIAALRAARLDFLELVRKFRHAEALFRGAEVLPDASRRGEGQFRNLDAVLWYLHKNYPDRAFPAFTSWEETHTPLFRAINRLHGGWREVAEYFYPLSESLVAPIILLTIYGHFNTEPLRGLQFKQVRKVSLLQNKHLQIRTVVQPGKERAAAPYTRSFPIDDNDSASPNAVLEFMKEWTKSIRSRAGKYAECFFICVTKANEVKAFATAQLDAKSGDSRWLHHLSNFCERHKLPDSNLTELRQTSLDYVRQISDNDIRSVLAMKGGSSESVVNWHYRSDAADSRAHAGIASLQASKERYIRTGGKIHHLGAPATQDLAAATPGCKCADPYDSPIPGEVQGAQCQAFGCCPGCPHGSPELGTAYGLARLLQLREALHEAKSNILLERWIQRYKRPLEVLENTWLPMFGDPKTWEQVKRMSLHPIGVIE